MLVDIKAQVTQHSSLNKGYLTQPQPPLLRWICSSITAIASQISLLPIELLIELPYIRHKYKGRLHALSNNTTANAEPSVMTTTRPHLHSRNIHIETPNSTKAPQFLLKLTCSNNHAVNALCISFYVYGFV